MRTLILLLLLTSIAVACRVDGYLLAVSNETGYLIPITVEARPGDGKVFVSPDPTISEDLQVSIRIASNLAMEIAGRKADLFYSFRTSSPSIIGMSGGVGLAGYAVSAILCRKPRDVLATGVVFPDGSVGKVAGIEKKIEAAKSIASGIIVPYSNTNSSDGFVMPVTNVYDAVEIMTGVRKKWRDANLEEFRKVMRDVAWMMIRRAEKMGADTSEMLSKFSEGEYYTAASLAFQSWVEKRREMGAGDLEMEFVRSYQPLPPKIDAPEDVEIYTIYLERVEEAKSSDDPAYEIERLITAEIWYSMMDRFNGGKRVDIQRISRKAFEEARAFYSYVYSISPEAARYVEKDYIMADKYLSSNPYLSLSYSLKAIAKASYALQVITANTSSVPQFSELAWKKVRDSKSFIAWNYVQLADYYADKDPRTALLYYTTAMTYASVFKEEDNGWLFLVLLLLGIKAFFWKCVHARNHRGRQKVS